MYTPDEAYINNVEKNDCNLENFDNEIKLQFNGIIESCKIMFDG